MFLKLLLNSYGDVSILYCNSHKVEKIIAQELIFGYNKINNHMNHIPLINRNIIQFSRLRHYHRISCVFFCCFFLLRNGQSYTGITYHEQIFQNSSFQKSGKPKPHLKRSFTLKGLGGCGGGLRQPSSQEISGEVSPPTKPFYFIQYYSKPCKKNLEKRSSPEKSNSTEKGPWTSFAVEVLRDSLARF